MSRMNAWRCARNVPLADEHIQANTFFVATIAGDALSHMEGNFSRDYFIERIGHMTEQSLFPSRYARDGGSTAKRVGRALARCCTKSLARIWANAEERARSPGTFFQLGQEKTP